MRTIATILITLLLLPPALAAAPARAQTPTGSANTGDVLGTIITEVEKEIIERYLKPSYKSDRDKDKKNKGKKDKGSKKMPPGLAKRNTLPPGLAKQLEKNGTLPPGLAKRGLPNDLQSLLPRRIGQKFVIVDNDVVLIQAATNLVLDVLENVLEN